MAYPFPNLDCLLAQILVVSEHKTECTRGNREHFSLVSTPPYPVGMENRSRDFEVVSSLGKHGNLSGPAKMETGDVFTLSS